MVNGIPQAVEQLEVQRIRDSPPRRSIVREELRRAIKSARGFKLPRRFPRGRRIITRGKQPVLVLSKGGDREGRKSLFFKEVLEMNRGNSFFT